jgi:hypothetical protein
VAEPHGRWEVLSDTEEEEEELEGDLSRERPNVPEDAPRNDVNEQHVSLDEPVGESPNQRSESQSESGESLESEEDGDAEIPMFEEESWPVSLAVQCDEDTWKAYWKGQYVWAIKATLIRLGVRKGEFKGKKRKYPESRVVQKIMARDGKLATPFWPDEQATVGKEKCQWKYNHRRDPADWSSFVWIPNRIFELEVRNGKSPRVKLGYEQWGNDHTEQWTTFSDARVSKADWQKFLDDYRLREKRLREWNQELWSRSLSDVQASTGGPPLSRGSVMKRAPESEEEYNDSEESVDDSAED